MMKDYPCYRDYVISSLPQLKSLDGVEVTRTERFKAQQSLMENRHDIIQLQVDTNKECSEMSCLKHKSFINFFGFLSFLSDKISNNTR